MKAQCVFELPKELEERYKLDEFRADVILTRETIVMGDPYIISFRVPDALLKEIPEKLVPFGYLDVGNEDGLYEKGYNDCLDTIMGSNMAHRWEE